MLHKRLVSALTKVGATIAQRENYGFTATKEGGSTLTWHNDPNGFVGYVVKRHPDTDAMFDNFMDSYFKTIKEAVQAIGEPPYKSYKSAQ